MASTVITAPELHEETDDVIRSSLTEYVPMFRQRMDRGAGDLIGDLESIINHRLWERIGYDSMEAYAREHLQHSEQWCREVIRIYRHDWSPEQRQRRTVADLVALVEPAADPHSRPGNKNAMKKDENAVVNYSPESAPKRKRKNGAADPEYVIARLKRDAADEAMPADVREKATFLLAGIERGEVKPYRAARAMGWVKPPDPVATAHRAREKMQPDQAVEVWRDWGRTLPDGALDRVAVAKDAYMKLTDDQRSEFLSWATGI
jgi:hypothetical protein